MVWTKHWCQRQLKIDSHLWPICLIYNTYFHFILPSTDRDRVKLMVAGGGKIILQLLFNVIFKRGQGQQCKRQGEGWTWEQHLKCSSDKAKIQVTSDNLPDQKRDAFSLSMLICVSCFNCDAILCKESCVSPLLSHTTIQYVFDT